MNEKLGNRMKSRRFMVARKKLTVILCFPINHPYTRDLEANALIPLVLVSNKESSYDVRNKKKHVLIDEQVTLY